MKTNLLSSTLVLVVAFAFFAATVETRSLFPFFENNNENKSAYYVWAEIGTFKGDPNDEALAAKDNGTWWGRRVQAIKGNITVSAKTATSTISEVGGRVNQYIGGHKIIRVDLPANLTEVLSLTLRLETDDPKANETIVLTRNAVKVTSPRIFGQHATFFREKPRLQLNADNEYVRNKPRNPTPPTRPTPPPTTEPPTTEPPTTEPPTEPTTEP